MLLSTVFPSGDGWQAHATDWKVYALMHKLESGHKRGGRTDWSLKHEQGHFDITEICARSLRPKVGQLRGRGDARRSATLDLEVTLDRAYEELLTKWQALQQRYDGETHHGTRKRQQKKWWKTLASRLEEDPPTERCR